MESKLKAGDVVVIKEGGWGFLYEDKGKSVKLLENIEGSWRVAAYDCELETKMLCLIDEKSFGENPLILLNVYDESVLEKGRPQPIKSDGGSSSYYELTITNKAGETIKVETGDVIRAMVGNDFDFGNCLKALRRMYLATQGKGKEGIDVTYDANKVRYFLNEIERVNK